jgi:hypothetical protein
MLIADLSHLEVCHQPTNILGGVQPGNVLSLSYKDNVLSLSLGEEELFQRVLEIDPVGLRFAFKDTHQGSISFTNTTNVIDIGPIRSISSSSGATTSIFSLIPYPYFL